MTRIHAGSEVKFSTYHDDEPPISLIREIHDRIALAIMDTLEEMDIKRSHISVQCQVGYVFATFYGNEDEEIFSLNDDDEEDADDGA